MRSRRLRWLLFVVPVAIALVLGLAAANRFAGPFPPRTITIATGREEGAYYAFATEYQKLIARQGFRLKIVPGAGSVETLERLKAGEVMVGLVQAGTASATDAESLVSLASLFYEPLWVFRHKSVRASNLSDLRGRRLAVGEEGSGARMLALQLLRDNDVTTANSTLLALGPADAEAALAAGRIDAGLFVMAPSAPIVLKLLRRTDVELMSERRARARTVPGIPMPQPYRQTSARARASSQAHQPRRAAGRSDEDARGGSDRVVVIRVARAGPSRPVRPWSRVLL
jgi:TRAP transporter TAXI family solute receptor